MMKLISSFEDVREHINKIRGLHRGFHTNFFPEQRKIQIWCAHHMLSVLELGDTDIFMKKDEGFTSIMYCTSNLDELFIALSQLPQDDIYVVDLIVDARTDISILDRFVEVGYKIRNSLVRMSMINKKQHRVHDLLIDFHATENDIPELTALLYANFDKYSEQLPTLEELKDFIEARHVIIQRIGGNIAGFIIYDQSPSTLYLRYWLVNSEYRNQGVGSSLFREFSIRGNECKRHMLWVMEDNDNAIIRYKHYGYIEENMRNYVLTFNLN